MKFHRLIAVFIAGAIFGCQPNNAGNNQEVEVAKEEVAVDIYENIPLEVKNGLQAHGGLALWRSFGSLSFDVVKKDKREHQIIDLNTRKVYIENEKFKVGFDGEMAWISPDMEAMGGGSPRFYQGVYFYFFALPHVLGDPGINFEILAPRSIDSIQYDVVKVSFNDGIGDAPKDYYVAHFDQNTHRLEWLLYTVTYYSGESTEKYNAVKYDGWQNVNGLLVPTAFRSFKYVDGEVGEERSSTTFENVKFDKDSPDPSIFSKPAIAAIDSSNVK